MEEFARPPRSTSKCPVCGARGKICWQLIEVYPQRTYEPVCPACQAAQADSFTAAEAISLAQLIIALQWTGVTVLDGGVR